MRVAEADGNRTRRGPVLDRQGAPPMGQGVHVVWRRRTGIEPAGAPFWIGKAHPQWGREWGRECTSCGGGGRESNPPGPRFESAEAHPQWGREFMRVAEADGNRTRRGPVLDRQGAPPMGEGVHVVWRRRTGIEPAGALSHPQWC